MSGNTILTKNEKKIPKAPKAKAKVISFENFTNSIRFIFPTQKHDTLHFLLTSLDLFVYICLLKFARTQTDSGSRLPVEKYLSLFCLNVNKIKIMHLPPNKPFSFSFQ